MKIRIIGIGKIKEQYLRDGINEYINRLKPYSQVEIIEVNDEPIVDNPTPGEITKAINNEGKRVLKLLKDSDYVIALDLVKKQPNSLEFADFLNKKFILGGSYITFVIGGSYGLSDELKKRSNDAVCFSNLTFTHQMIRLILLEQIYRAFKINRNETYHK